MRNIRNVVFDALSAAEDMGYNFYEKTELTITTDLFLNCSEIANETFNSIRQYVNEWMETVWKHGENTGVEVELSYFKRSGKYYSSGTYRSFCNRAYDIFEEVRGMQSRGELPGLIKGGGMEFHIYVRVYVSIEKDILDIPALIMPIADSDEEKI